jgi:hypothetical protein
MAWKELLDEAKIGVANGIAGLDGAGTVPDAQIPGLSASKITSGTLADARIPTLAIGKITGLQTSLDSKVPTTRTINGKPLSGNVSLTKGDVGLGLVENKSSADIRSELTVADLTATGLDAADVGARSDSWLPSKSEIGLGNVENKSSATIRSEITLANVTGTGIKTNDLIPTVTTLPASGADGEMCIKDGILYKWVS